MIEKHNYPKKSENLWTVNLEFRRRLYMEKEKIKWLEWSGNVEEWGEIECPMLGNEWVMTYYPKGTPCYYSYTAPFMDESGDVCYYRFDHDEGCWDEDVMYTICQSEEYQESMIFKM